MNWFQRNFKTIIYAAFLVPILTVAFVSISHVTKWYGLSNPLSWAIYLSVGIEIAALSALAAISASMGRKVYFPFFIVTLIQFLGNIFFAYQFIDVNSQPFRDWVDLVDPVVSFMGVESGDMIGHKRFLALFSGGMLPIISLSFLHMLVKFEEEEKKKSSFKDTNKEEDKLVPVYDIDELSKQAGKQEAELEKEKYTPTQEELQILEQKLQEINENKFKKLEGLNLVVEEKQESENEVVLDEQVEEVTSEPEITNETSEQPKINRLSYMNRNASNVSVQRV